MSGNFSVRIHSGKYIPISLRTLTSHLVQLVSALPEIYAEKWSGNLVQRCHGKFEAIIVRVIHEEPQMVEIRFLVTEGPYPDGELETLHD